MVLKRAAFHIYRRWATTDHRRVLFSEGTSRLLRLAGIDKVKGQLDGHTLYVSTKDTWGIRKFYLPHGYNMHPLVRLRELLETDPEFVFWDIGANYGAYTVMMNSVARQCIAVEPASETARHLEMNCRRLKRPVIVERCAASATHGQCELYLAPGFSGDNRCYPVASQQRPHELVAMRTLDEIAGRHFSPLPRKNVVKIDVQGSEPAVLRGASKLIRGSEKCFIWLEVWPKGLKEFGESLESLVSVCQQLSLVSISDDMRIVAWDGVMETLKQKGESFVSNLLLASDSDPD